MSAMTNYVLPPMAWLSTVHGRQGRQPRRAAGIPEQAVHHPARHRRGVAVGLDPTVHVPVPALIDRAERFATFPRLWAFEGIGNYYAERSGSLCPGGSVDLLTDTSTTTLPARALTMLHAGIGMSFANRLLRKLETSLAAGSRSQHDHAVRQSVPQSSRPATGAALELLGLATRTLYPNLLASIDRELGQGEPELVGVFLARRGTRDGFEPTTLCRRSRRRGARCRRSPTRRRTRRRT